jgi:hypothetical protein
MGKWKYKIHVFFISALLWGESTSRPGRFTAGESAPGTYFIRGWVDPKAGLDDVERRNSWPYRNSNYDLSVVQPVGSPYIDCAIPALQDCNNQDIIKDDTRMRNRFKWLRTEFGWLFRACCRTARISPRSECSVSCVLLDPRRRYAMRPQLACGSWCAVRIVITLHTGRAIVSQAYRIQTG